MKILITGSNGMIGSRLVSRLQKKHTIVEFSRENGKDITRLEDVEKAIHGVDVVIHAAAEIDESKGESEIMKVNVGGTENLLMASEEEGINQFIFISSVGVFGQSTTRLDEKSEMSPITPYERSKKEGEAKVWNMQEVFPVTIIRPAMVMGPTPYWESIFKIVRKGFPLIGKGENAWQMIYVDDLVDFIAHAVGNEEMYNEIYIAAENETHSLREVVDMIAEIEHVKPPKSVPKIVGLIGSHFWALKGKVTGKKQLLIPAHVKRLLKHREYNISKALSTGWKPKFSTKEALQKTFEEIQKK